MASDQRWTGGVANREWQSGTRPATVVDVDAVTTQVRSYLRDCRRFRLDPQYHPTIDGVLKLVFWRGAAQKEAVLAVFRQLTAGRPAEAVSG